MHPDLCIYHAHCADGFAAAWAVRARWPAVRFHAASYGDAPPDVAGLTVLIVDFSYPADVLAAMGAAARSITILDHHKTAQADLAQFAVSHPVSYRDIDVIVAATQPGLGNVRAIFDMDRAGARMAWDFCHPLAPPPRLINHIADRDLWRFNLAATREICAAVASYPFFFQDWDALFARCDDSRGRASLIEEGRAILRAHDIAVNAALDQSMRYMIIGGHPVPVANAPKALASDAAHQLAEGAPFAATYFDRADGRREFSLRSQAPDGADVSIIAAAYGGGGHKHAAGFTAECGWEGEDISRCIACALPLKPGDPYYDDVSGGVLHAACLGPERECYVRDLDTAEPLRDGEPIPQPQMYEV